jgi:hypothetical protein
MQEFAIEQREIGAELLDLLASRIEAGLRTGDQQPKHESGQNGDHVHRDLHHFLRGVRSLILGQYFLQQKAGHPCPENATEGDQSDASKHFNPIEGGVATDGGKMNGQASFPQIR